MKHGVQIFEEDSKILEAIAQRYSADSKEYAALTHAAMALLYVLTERNEKFMEHVVANEAGLGPEQRAHLRSLGIDPDSDIS
jgi:FixJ family two-component response regulator